MFYLIVGNTYANLATNLEGMFKLFSHREHIVGINNVGLSKTNYHKHRITFFRLSNIKTSVVKVFGVN